MLYLVTCGKSHNYPSYRKPYSSGHLEERVTMIRRKENDSVATSNMPTYFDMQLQ